MGQKQSPWWPVATGWTKETCCVTDDLRCWSVSVLIRWHSLVDLRLKWESTRIYCTCCPPPLLSSGNACCYWLRPPWAEWTLVSVLMDTQLYQCYNSPLTCQLKCLSCCVFVAQSMNSSSHRKLHHISSIFLQNHYSKNNNILMLPGRFHNNLKQKSVFISSSITSCHIVQTTRG